MIEWFDAISQGVGTVLKVIGGTVSVLSLKKHIDERNDPKWREEPNLLGDYYIFYRRPRNQIVTAVMRFSREKPSIPLWGKHRMTLGWSRRRRTRTRLLAPCRLNGIVCNDISDVARASGTHPFDLFENRRLSESVQGLFDIRGSVYFDDGASLKYFFINAEGYGLFENSMHIGFRDPSSTYDVFLTIGGHVDHEGYPSACETVFVRRGLIEKALARGIYPGFRDALDMVARAGEEGDHNYMMNPITLNPLAVKRITADLRKRLEGRDR